MLNDSVVFFLSGQELHRSGSVNAGCKHQGLLILISLPKPRSYNDGTERCGNKLVYGAVHVCRKLTGLVGGADRVPLMELWVSLFIAGSWARWPSRVPPNSNGSMIPYVIYKSAARFARKFGRSFFNKKKVCVEPRMVWLAFGLRKWFRKCLRCTRKPGLNTSGLTEN